MRAVTYNNFGGIDVLQIAEIEAPQAGPGQIRLRVIAAGMNPVDYKIRNGWMPDMVPAEMPALVGLEAAGVVDQVGAGVTGVQVGDSVLAPTITGSFAQHALAEDFSHKPADLGWETAAALPVGLETADRVVEELAVAEGETVVVHGAAGVVGAFAVQIAIARGATVIGTASPRNHDYLRSLGAYPVTYGEGLRQRIESHAPHGVDAIADIAGHSVLELSVDILGSADRLVTISDPRAFELGIRFSGQSRPFGSKLSHYSRLVESGAMGVRISGRHSMSGVREASAVLESGHADGKMILFP